MEFNKDFKLALSRLPAKEKDKLLLRLLKRDIALSKRLYFELVSTRSVEETRVDMEEHVVKRSLEISNYYRNPVLLMKAMRYISGDISKHVYTTKDKYGTVSLNILLLNQILSLNNDKLNTSDPNKAHKFSVYIITKAYRILINLNSLHPDFHADFNDSLSILQDQILKSKHVKECALKNGFDTDWLDGSNIPEDIEKIYKDIKSNGYLR